MTVELTERAIPFERLKRVNVVYKMQILSYMRLVNQLRRPRP